MIDLYDLLSTSVDSGEHPEEIDFDLEFERMLEQNQFLERFESGLKNGNLDLGDLHYFGDMLAEHGINPNEFATEFDEAFWFALNHNLLSLE